MKTLLIPTDFSLNAETAMHFAAGIAQKTNADLFLLHAIEIPNEETPSNETTKERADQTKAALQQLESLCTSLKLNQKTNCRYSVEFCNNTVDCITDMAKQEKADMIVMGTKGDKGAADFVFGTVTSGVIEFSSCAVLAIPEGTNLNKPIKKITYASDFLLADIESLTALSTIAYAYEAELSLMHVYDQEDPNTLPEHEVAKLDLLTKNIAEVSRYKRLSIELLSGNDAESKLLEYVNSGKTDMLVMSTKHRNYFGRLFDQSVTLNLARLTPIPMMAFHHRNRKRLEDV